jgi:uncharacterized membrane protein
MLTLLDCLVLLGAGVTAGVLFGVALSVVPAFDALPAEGYLRLHRLIGRHFDPTMPIIVLTSTVTAIVRACLTGLAAQRLLFAGAAVLLFAVSVVSHLGNVPINRLVKAGAGVPPGLAGLRRRWRTLNLLRTALACLALAFLAVAVHPLHRL